MLHYPKMRGKRKKKNEVVVTFCLMLQMWRVLQIRTPDSDFASVVLHFQWALGNHCGSLASLNQPHRPPGSFCSCRAAVRGPGLSTAPARKSLLSAVWPNVIILLSLLRVRIDEARKQGEKVGRNETRSRACMCAETCQGKSISGRDEVTPAD